MPSVGVDQILEFFEVASGDAFDVAPAKAIEFFKAKGLTPTFSYGDMVGQAHDHSFTVAKMMDVDMLGQVRASLDSALANGVSFKDWAKEITPGLQKAGWWGKKKVIDPDTKRLVDAQLGSPARLETIFRTNMQSAYATGAWQEIDAQADEAPFLMYDAVDDLRTRPLHASWDRKVLPVQHQWWASHFPPNGYNCRCGVIQLDAQQVQQLGLQVAPQPPDDGLYLWNNPRTGYSLPVPRGLDPGFDRNPGMTMIADAKKLLQEKISAQGAVQQAAARAALAQAKGIALQAQTAAMQAQAELASAAAAAALKRAQEIAADKAAQWAAQEQIDVIAKGDKGAVGVGAQYKTKALQTLKKGDSWPELKPTEQLQQIEDLAASLKKKTEDASKLSVYKKAILEGKVPPPATVKVFSALPDADKAQFLAKLETEKAAIEAQKAAAAAAAQKAAQEAAEQAEKAAQAAQAAKAASTPAAPPVAPQPFAQARTLDAGTPPDPNVMVQIGEQKGSNPGGTYQDTDTGVKWYVKQPASEDIARNEVLAGKLYELAGIDVPEMHIIALNGRASIASRIVDGLVKADAKTLAGAPGAADGFAVDAWLANWDVVGLGFDNLLTKGARAFRVDTGGALRYRAQGGLKGAAFGDSVSEMDSLRDPSLNRQSFDVFGRMTPGQIEDSVVQVLRMRDTDIRAVVEQFGPTDMTERAALAERLIARKADLERRYPGAALRARQLDEAAAKPPPAAARVTDAEQRAVEDSRVNGYGFPTDSDQIEDHMVVVHNYRTKAGGDDATRGFFKLRPEASGELLQRIQSNSSAGPSVQLSDARDAILAAIKSINFRAANIKNLDAATATKIESAQAKVAEAVNKLNAAIAEAVDPAQIADLSRKRDLLTDWGKMVGARLGDAKAGKQAVKIPGMFPSGGIPDSLSYTPKAAPSLPAGLSWNKISGTYKFDTADFDRSFATLNGRKSEVDGTTTRYEATLPDGTRITYFPHDRSVAWAMQGVIKIDVPGKGGQATRSVFDAMDSAGLKSARATEVDRQHLYLNAFARVSLIRTNAYAEFNAITDMGKDGVLKKLGLIKRATGVDVFKSEGWKTVDGVRQAFGHGRAYQLRPDLDAAAMRELDRTHVVFHNPKGLGTDAGSGVFEKLKPVIDGGGMFASLTDRVRRGVPLYGTSVSSDLESGGGDYHFTRIRARSEQTGSGVYWKTSTLRRMDAISYASDEYGRTTAGFVENNRKGQTIDSFKSLARNLSNETIFKGGLSMFDDIDRIVLSSQDEVDEAIAFMKSRSYARWPDGRELTEVIITKAKHAKNP